MNKQGNECMNKKKREKTETWKKQQNRLIAINQIM